MAKNKTQAVLDLRDVDLTTWDQSAFSARDQMRFTQAAMVLNESQSVRDATYRLLNYGNIAADTTVRRHPEATWLMIAWYVAVVLDWVPNLEG